MKKIVSLALACMLLVSCFAINAFAAETFTFTASELDANNVFGLTLNTAANLKTGKFVLSYDSTKVALLNADGTAVTATAASNAFTAEVVAENLAPTASGIKYDAANYDLTYTFAMDDATGAALTGDLVTIYFKKVGNIAEGDTPIWVINSTSPNYAKTGSGWKAELTFNGGFGFNQHGSSTTYRKANGTGVEKFVFDAIVDAPIVEDKFINDETSAVAGTTLTFAGRVGAEWMNQTYGVEFTSNKVGTRAQKYYGAKNGDTVALDAAAGTTQTFTFGAWDGTFEIILEGVTAGDKEFKFFVGDNYTDAAIVTVQ